MFGEGFGVGFLDVGWNVFGVPGGCGITPRAFYGAALEADEVGGLAKVATFALPGVEAFVDGKGGHGRVPFKGSSGRSFWSLRGVLRQGGEPALGVFSDEGGEGFVKMAGDAFAGGAFDEVNLEEAVFGERLELGAWVGGGKDGGVVEVFVYPVGRQ